MDGRTPFSPQTKKLCQILVSQRSRRCSPQRFGCLIRRWVSAWRNQPKMFGPASSAWECHFLQFKHYSLWTSYYWPSFTKKRVIKFLNLTLNYSKSAVIALNINAYELAPHADKHNKWILCSGFDALIQILIFRDSIQLYFRLMFLSVRLFLLTHL